MARPYSRYIERVGIAPKKYEPNYLMKLGNLTREAALALIYTNFNKIAHPSSLIFLLISLCAGPGHASEFQYKSSTRSIEMKGIIRVGDDITFRSLLRSHPETESITLRGSAGGEYTSSLQISLEIKKRGLNTTATNYCHSACAYIWLAGATRKVIGGVNPKIHLPYEYPTGQALPKLTYSWLKALGLPGTFANAVVRSVGPKNRFVKLTPAFLAKFGASTAQDV